MRKYPRKFLIKPCWKSIHRRHNGGLSPGGEDDGISPEHLEELKKGFYETKEVVNSEEAIEVEKQTRDQTDSQEWISERRKRLTASVVGGIAKLRSTCRRKKGGELTQYQT